MLSIKAWWAQEEWYEGIWSIYYVEAKQGKIWSVAGGESAWEPYVCHYEFIES